MPLKEETLVRQLNIAETERSNLEKHFEGSEPKKQPMWRQANAKVSSLEKRLEKARSRSGAEEATAE